MKKKLAIFLCLAVLLSSMASLGLTTLAGGANEGTVIFSTDFSTATIDGLAALKTSGTWSYDNNGDGTRTNKVIDGAWEVNETARVDKWRSAFGTYNPSVPLTWNEGKTYRVEFDWSITGYAASTAGLRVFLETDMGQGVNTEGTRAYQHKVIEETVRTGAETGTVSWEFTMSADTALTPITDNAAMRIVLRGLGITAFTIDNLKITDLTPPSDDEDDDAPAAKEIFSTDFSTDTVDGIAILSTANTYSYANNSAGTRTNKPINGAWTVNETATVTKWRGAFGTYNPAVPLAWSEGKTYRIEFDWSITGYADTTAGLRAILETDMGQGVNTDGTRAYQYKVIEEVVHTGADSGTVSWEVTLSAGTVMNAIADKAALRIVFRGLGLTAFTIDNLKITDLNPAPEVEEDDNVLFNSDFTTLPAEVVAYNSGNNYFRNVGAVDGVLACNTRVTNGSSAWHNGFTVGKDAPFMTWESAETGNNVYKIEFDWALPVATDSGQSKAELRMLVYIEGTTDRIIQPTIVKGEKAAGTSGKYQATLSFNGSKDVSNVDGESNYKVYLAFLAAYMDSFTIDNLKITDLSPDDAEEEPVGSETVILNTDFSTATVDGLLALGGGTAKYYGDAEGDINGIADGVWKSYKANYAADTAEKKQWYSAWGTHTTENPIIWGQNYAYRVEFDWTIPGACDEAQFRVIMEGAHLDNPSLNNNGNPRPYQVGVYNTDGTYGKASYAHTQTESSSGSFKATFAVNNLNLAADDTPVNGQTMRILIRSQLETFTIDNLKITRVAIEPDVKDESNMKVLLDTDFTSVPLGLGNTWGGAYEISGVNDEKDVWVSDAEETPAGWKMVFNTIYNIVPIVWGEGHSYKIELSYSLPKGSGENGRFELVLDKDDGTQNNRGMQKTVFKATPDKMIEAGDTVYTFETTFVTSGDAANKADGGVLVTDDHMMLKFMTKTLPAIHLHSVKITDLNAALTPEIILPEVDDSEEEESQPINVWIKLVDEDGAPMANQYFKPDSGELLQLDENGCYQFKDIVSGAYTINLADEDGNILASAYYTILAGDATDIFGNFATIDSSVTDLYITLEYAAGKLTVKDMTVAANEFGATEDDEVILDDTDAPATSPDTGVAFPVTAVVVLLLASVAVFCSKKSRVNG